jgi:ribosomal protein S24E
MYKVSDKNTIFLFGFKTQFGGGKSTGFGLIYDTVQDAKRIEPRFRLVRVRDYYCGYLHFIARTSTKGRKVQETDQGEEEQSKEGPWCREDQSLVQGSQEEVNTLNFLNLI